MVEDYGQKRADVLRRLKAVEASRAKADKRGDKTWVELFDERKEELLEELAAFAPREGGPLPGNSAAGGAEPERRKAEEPEEESPAKEPAGLSPDAEEANRLRKEELKLEKEKLELEKQELEQRKRERGGTNRPKKWLGHAKTAVGPGGSTLFVILAFIIYFVDAWIGYIGFTEIGASWSSIFQTIVGIAASSVFSFFMILHVIPLLGSLRENIGEIITYTMALMLVLFTGYSGGLTGWALAHLLFLLAFWYFIIGPNEDRLRRNILLIVLLIVDFYLYVILKSFLPIGTASPLIAVPIMFFVVLGYCWNKVGNRVAWALIVLVLGILLLANYNYITTQIKIAATTAPVEGLKRASPLDVLKKAGDGLKHFFKDIQKSAKSQLEYATGGYYKGKVEENQDPNNQLGVYITKLEAADKTFYENEEVVVWGNLKARTLDQPIKVSLSCETDNAKGTVIPDTLAKGYEIQKLEEIAFECRFGGGLKPGSNTIKVRTDFNFETLAYLKTHFMDIERARALRRENIDPLDEYGITDKKPSAVYTNGPVKLGMGTIDPPVGLSRDSSGYSYVGVTVEKQWLGQIQNITGLTIQVPMNLELEEYEGNYCRGDFEQTFKDKGGYSIYTLKEDAIKKIKTPIEAYKSWRCSITIPKGKTEEVLGKTPVAVYYYRANATYIYEIQKSASVYIKGVPGKTKLRSCDIVCNDEDGCICDTGDRCNMPRNSSIGKTYTCDNYPGTLNIARDFDRAKKDINNALAFIQVAVDVNNLCLKNKTEQIKESLKEDELKELNDVVDACAKRSPPFFELSEGIIIKKINLIVGIFKVQKDKDLTNEEKQGMDNLKDRAMKKLDGVLTNFNEISGWGGVDPKKQATFIKTVQNKKSELEGYKFT